MYILSITLAYNTACGVEKKDKFHSDEYFVVDAFFNTNEIGLIVKHGLLNDVHFFKINREKLNVSSFGKNDFRKMFGIQDDQMKRYEFLYSQNTNIFKTTDGQLISYSLNDCVKKETKEKEYLSRDSACKSAIFKINQENIIFDKDPFYTWEKFADPVLFKNKLIFKNVVVENYSGDTEKKYPERVGGFVVFSLEDRRRYPISYSENSYGYFSSVFENNFVSLLKNDSLSNLLWIGSNYGFYGLNENLEEKISCYFIKEMKTNKVKELKCSQADYLEDNKHDQAELLLEKEQALKKGKSPPEDRQKKLNAEAICLKKVGSLFSKYSNDKNKDRDFDPTYRMIFECLLLGPIKHQQKAKNILEQSEKQRNIHKS